jgi:hypothetical protein
VSIPRLLSLRSHTNIHVFTNRTNAQLRTYVNNNYLIKATLTEVDKLLTLYPDDVTAGSPFDTGRLNAITPQFKRLAAIQGDLVFQAPRRYLLDKVSSKQSAWSFRKLHSLLVLMSSLILIRVFVVSKRGKGIPVLGSVRLNDLTTSRLWRLRLI